MGPKTKKRLVIGLGNPEPDYSATRHNLGKTALNEFVSRHEGDWDRRRNHLVATLTVSDVPLILVKCTAAYMNESGGAVAAIAKEYQVKPQDMIIVYDDLDLPLGTVRVRINTSSGGHNGIGSIITSLASTDFVRIRIGIGPKRGDAKKYVIRPWPKSQQQLVVASVEKACDALEFYLAHGLEKTAAHFS